MPVIDYSEGGAIGRGIAEGLGKVQEKRETDQLRELNKQWSIEAFNRAKAWEIEKMEIVSRMDNEIKNQRYVKRMSQWQAGDEYIDSIADKHPSEQVTMMRFTLDQQFAKDIPEAGARLGIGLYEKAMMDAKRKSGVLGLLGGEGGGIDPDNVLGLDIATPAESYTIPPTEQVRQLEAENKFRVISPNGDEEIIEGEDWPALKEKGYILADIAELRRKRKAYTPPRDYYRGFGGRGL